MTLSDLQCRILAALDAIDATAPTPIGELERQADVQFAVGRGAEQRPADEALRGLLGEGRVCLEDGYISLAPVPSRLLVTTHQFADLDALASALAVGYITGRAFDLRFDSTSAPHYHAPRVGLYTVDVGGGPLDHHERGADGRSTADRTTCAFIKVCEHFMEHGSPVEQHRAHGLLEYAGPVILRQDSTGSIAGSRDEIANRLGLPAMIKRLRARLGDDQAVAAAVSPLLGDLFDEAVAYADALRAAEAQLPEALVFDGGSVIAVVSAARSATQQLQQQLLHVLAWARCPQARLLVYVSDWLDEEGKRITVSRGVSRREGELLHIGACLRHLLARQALSPELAAEVERWHKEDWYSGRGTRTYPVTDEPPPWAAEGLAAALAALLEEAEVWAEACAVDEGDPAALAITRAALARQFAEGRA